AVDTTRLIDTLYSIGDGVVTVDVEERIAFLNKVAETLTGWTLEEARGRPLPEIFRIVDQITREPRRNPVAEAMETGLIVQLIQPTLLITKAGAENLIADSVSPIYDHAHRIVGAVLIFRDITTKHLHDQELIKMQKLESVGVLAGGIAHDFNNLLTVILGSVALAKLSGPSEARELLTDAEAACGRARGLTQQLLTFSSGGAPVRARCQLGPIIASAITLCLAGSNVRAEVHLAEQLWAASADDGQLGQVLTNLVMNASQSMPHGGVVHIGAHNVTVGTDGVITAGKQRIRPGFYVRVTVEDAGCGIPPSIIERVFDPYFSTKAQGSGLGLAISYSIIHKHGGYIYCTSTVGQGSCFSLYIPAWQGPHEPLPTPGASSAIMGTGRILLMDDDATVCAVAERILEYLGYQVSVAQDGHEALALYQAAHSAGRPYDLVVVDLTVPGSMGGLECMRQLRRIHPPVKVVISSGYSNDPILGTFAEHGFQGVVMKPYDVVHMSAVIHQVLRSPAPEARLRRTDT
ncbi:MAG TPA: ATP-binding protein, partial [Acidiferrobacteraceae bacterium]|nr:ATP-binding protein [Acidiferrobacteraceae bacterium]